MKKRIMLALCTVLVAAAGCRTVKTETTTTTRVLKEKPTVGTDEEIKGKAIGASGVTTVTDTTIRTTAPAPVAAPDDELKK